MKPFVLMIVAFFAAIPFCAAKDASQSDIVTGKLRNLGLCSACAGNAAYQYMHFPSFHCSKVVGKALRGDRSAIAALNNDAYASTCPYPDVGANGKILGWPH